jgi:hypothetical protein
MSTNEFSVCLFFPDGSYHYERRSLGAEAAVMLARDVTLRPAALAGLIGRVIITDGDDFACFEWTHGQGVTFPLNPRPGRPFLTGVRGQGSGIDPDNPPDF